MWPEDRTWKNSVCFMAAVVIALLAVGILGGLTRRAHGASDPELHSQSMTMPEACALCDDLWGGAARNTGLSTWHSPTPEVWMHHLSHLDRRPGDLCCVGRYGSLRGWGPTWEAAFAKAHKNGFRGGCDDPEPPKYNPVYTGGSPCFGSD